MKPSKRNLARAEKVKQGPPPVSKYAAKRRPQRNPDSPFAVLATLETGE